VAHPGRVGGAVKLPARKPRTASRAAPPIRTPGGLLRGIGRVLLWALVVVLLIRGLAGVLAQDTSPPAARPVARVAPATWPDDAARSFAADFARAYLSWSPGHPDRYETALRPFVSAEISSLVVPSFGEDATREVVQATSVARVVALDRSHALVTVAAAVAKPEVVTRYLTVPVARDAAGGLVVDDLPSFAAPPARARVTEPETQQLSPADQQQIGDVLEHFLSAYLAGRSEDLAYYSPPGVRIGAVAGGYAFAGMSSLVAVGPVTGPTRTVLVAVRARDADSRIEYPLRFRVRLVMRDRWYVAAINASGKG
jgi:Conjugative transposon protein TcpC